MKTAKVIAFVLLSMSMSFAAPKPAHKDLAYHAAAHAKHAAHKASAKVAKGAYAFVRFVF